MPKIRREQYNCMKYIIIMKLLNVIRITIIIRTLHYYVDMCCIHLAKTIYIVLLVYAFHA